MENARHNSSEPYVVHFPPERSIGLLYIDGGGEGAARFADGKTSAEAQGDVILFPGKHLAFMALTEYVSTKRLYDDDILYLLAVSDLDDLMLNHTDLTDAGMRHIARFPTLTYLGIESTRVTDIGLRYLQECTTLRALSLKNPIGDGVTDGGIKHLRSLTNLHALHLTRARTTDSGVEYLNVLPISRLGLDQTPITDTGLKHLGSLSHLTYLDLSQTAVSDRGMAYLGACAQLSDLRLRMTEVTDAAIPELQSLVALRSLDLGGTNITGRGIALFTQPVTTLRLDDCAITDADMESLDRLLGSVPIVL